MSIRHRIPMVLLLAVPLARAAEAPVGAGKTVLGIDGTRFTLNGVPTFLLGASYYAGLGASDDAVRRDLDELRERGFNWVRVWATWGAYGQDVSAVDKEGNPREPYRGRLVKLVSECDRRGMVVDVTLHRSAAADSGGLFGAEAHARAVETVTQALAEHRNWYLDLANERDVGDARYVSVEELRTLRARARELAPTLPVTASFGGHDLSEEDIRNLLEEVGADFLAPHRPRQAGSAEQTEAHTRRCLEIMRGLGRTAPVHYQEPFRRGYGSWEPSAADFLADLSGAVAGGAAGWCFHNGGQRRAPDELPRRSFDMTAKGLMEQLDPEETAVIAGAAQALADAAGPEILFSCDFESDEWFREWGEAREPERVETVSADPGLKFEPLRGKALKVRVDKGGHYGLSLQYDFRKRLGYEPEEIYFRYYIRLADDWDAARGGKFPGIGGTYGRAGWGGRPVDGTDGWSARGLFEGRRDGKTPIGFYCYHMDMKGRYGSNWVWDRDGRGLLENNRWYCVEQYVKLNTPGRADGILRGWVDGEPAFEKTDIRFRSVDSLKIECVWVNVYLGGTWTAESEHHLYIDDVAIAAGRIGPGAAGN